MGRPGQEISLSYSGVGYIPCPTYYGAWGLVAVTFLAALAEAVAVDRFRSRVGNGTAPNPLSGSFSAVSRPTFASKHSNWYM